MSLINSAIATGHEVSSKVAGIVLSSIRLVCYVTAALMVALGLIEPNISSHPGDYLRLSVSIVVAILITIIVEGGITGLFALIHQMSGKAGKGKMAGLVIFLLILFAASIMLGSSGWAVITASLGEYGVILAWFMPVVTNVVYFLLEMYKREIFDALKHSIDGEGLAVAVYEKDSRAFLQQIELDEFDALQKDKTALEPFRAKYRETLLKGFGQTIDAKLLDQVGAAPAPQPAPEIHNQLAEMVTRIESLTMTVTQITQSTGGAGAQNAQRTITPDEPDTTPVQPLATLDAPEGILSLPEPRDTDELEAIARNQAPDSQAVVQEVYNPVPGSYEEAVRALLDSEPGLSAQTIAGRVGCSVTTANRWKKEIEMQGVQP